MWSRRDFLKTMFVTGGLLITPPKVSASFIQSKVSQNPSEKIYRAVNGTPEQNLKKIIQLIGGIERIIGSGDVVLIKPNVQWWSQGASNLMALATFVNLIMDRSGGFRGEVIISENCHRGPSPWAHDSSGWVHEFERNSDLANVTNFNELSRILKDRYRERFSTCHLIDVGAGNKRVSGPSDGSGYVYCDGSNGVPLMTCENGASGSNYRATIMTYPT